MDIDPKADAEALASALDPENGYFNVRVLEDGTIIANHELIYTTALMVDLDRCGHRLRYCYPTRELAEAACNQLRTGDDRPLDGFIASRGSGAYTPGNPDLHSPEPHGRS